MFFSFQDLMWFTIIHLALWTGFLELPVAVTVSRTFFFFFNDIDSFEEYCCGILQNTSHLEFVWCFFSWLDCSNVSLGRKTIEIKYNSYHSILSHMINIIFTFDVDFDHLVVIVLFARFLHGWVIQSSFYIVLFG